MLTGRERTLHQPAVATDVPLIRDFILALARYERLEHEAQATEEDLLKTLFGPKPFAEVLIAEEGNAPVGFALYFYSYSTFQGRPGIYLEDLFVSPEHRGKGYGKALLTRVAEIACENDCGRFEWSVLDWNQPSIDFYESLGARPLKEWIKYRVAPEACGSR